MGLFKTGFEQIYKLNTVNMESKITCSTEAPAWRNCRPDSAESMPPVAKIGKPGSAWAMADTARKAMGRMALPECMQTKKQITDKQIHISFTKLNYLIKCLTWIKRSSSRLPHLGTK